LRLFLAFIFSCIFLFASETTASSYANDDFDAEFNDTQNQELFDPLSSYNESMTTFNDSFYEYILKPTAEGYAFIVPQQARNGISNFFDNLLFPIRFANNLLQLKFFNAIEESERFMINSTMGILGFRDLADEELGIKAHDEDLGQTLGYYGLGSGFHIVLPFLGPSNVRDLVGLSGDMWLNPINYFEARHLNLLKNQEQALATTAFFTINETSLHVKEYAQLKKDAIKLYPFMRSLYESRRNKLIHE